MIFGERLESRGVIFLTLVSLFLAFFQACQDNSILKPACRIFEVDLVEKWWHPVDTQDGRHQKVFFGADGRIVTPFGNEMKYTLENCNAIRVEDPNDISIDHWTIKKLSDKELTISYERDYTVSYKRSPQ